MFHQTSAAEKAYLRSATLVYPNTKKQFPQSFLHTFLKALITIILSFLFFFLYDKYKEKLDVTVSIRAYRATQHTLQQCDKSQDIDAREDVAGTVPMIWSSCTHFMMHKFKPAEFHTAKCWR